MAVTDRPDYPPSAHPPHRSIGDVIRAALPTAAIQFLPECITAAKTVGRGATRRTVVSFNTNEMTPDDLLWLTGELGRPIERKPKVVGVVVWVPTEIYEGK